MRHLIVIVLLGISSLAHSGGYEDCFLENSKGVTDQARVEEIRNICREKHTAQKCRKYLPHNQPAGTSEMELSMAEESLKACLATCANASFVTRNFGNECSTD